MENNLTALQVERKTGQEQFTFENRSINSRLIDFWQWLGSDLSNNVFRGMLAEYIVACDLGLKSGIRKEWDAYDLITDEGIKVEVKSSAYLQSWHQTKLSKIEFSICPTNAWESSSNTFSTETKRQSDIYVFAVFKHQEKATLNPLDLELWDFYVLPTLILNVEVPTQRTIGLKSLLTLNPDKAKFGQIKNIIQTQVIS